MLYLLTLIFVTRLIRLASMIKAFTTPIEELRLKNPNILKAYPEPDPETLESPGIDDLTAE